MAEVKEGVVKWFDSKKGFGFISMSDGSGDVFVHYTDIVGEGYKSLKEGDRVKFQVVKSPKGLKATKVERIQ